MCNCYTSDTTDDKKLEGHHDEIEDRDRGKNCSVSVDGILLVPAMQQCSIYPIS
jgi:hypothetical protein